MVRSLAVFVTLAVTSSTALAQPPGLPAAPAADDEDADWEDTSYQGSIVAASAIGAGLLFAGGLAEGESGRDTEASNVLYSTGAAAMFLGAPLVHASKGEYTRAIGSLGLRLGLGVLGGMAGVALSTCNASEEWLCELDSFGPGVLVGASVASLIDAAAMSDQRRPRQRVERVWAPTVSANGSGGQVGLVGTF